MRDTSNFKVKIDGHIAWLTLNRPEKRNAMGIGFFEEIGKLFDDFDQDANLRVIIIKAEGKSFSARSAKLSGAPRAWAEPAQTNANKNAKPAAYRTNQSVPRDTAVALAVLRVFPESRFTYNLLC